MIRRRAYWLLVGLLAFAYLFLVAGSPLTVRGWSNHDDLYFLRMASKLLETGWFGPYNQFTLMKGPAYPAFIAASFVLGLPLLLTTQLVFVGACVALAGTLTLYPLPRAGALLCYAATLFNPMTFEPGAFAGLRTELYLALTVAVVAGWLALPLVARRWHVCSIMLLAVATGLAFAGFWMTREEGFWIIPALAVFAAAFGLLYWRRRERATLSRYAVGVATMLAAFAAADLAVSARNWSHYGFFGVVDIRAPGYTGAYQALARVRPLEWKPYLPVPQEVRERIYAVSPAFSELRAGLEPSGFKQQACPFPVVKHACGDFASGWFLFALRDAVAHAGYYKSGDRAEAYYKRLADEVNSACENGRLTCDTPGFAFIPPLSWTIVRTALDSLQVAVSRMMFMSAPPLGPTPGSGSELFPFVAAITHSRLTPTPDKQEMPYSSIERLMINARGWVYHPDGEVEVGVEPGPGQFSASLVKRFARPDIVAAFKDPRTAMSGIDIHYNCQDPCYFVLRTASGVEARVPVPRKSSDTGSNANGFYIRYDFWSAGDSLRSMVGLPPPEILLPGFDRAKLAWRAWVVTAYRTVLFYALPVALAMLGWVVWRRLVDKRPLVWEPLLVLGFVVAAVATRIAMLALLDAVLTAPNGLSYDYISPATNLYALALAICICLPFVRRSGSGNKVAAASAGARLAQYRSEPKGVVLASEPDNANPLKRTASESRNPSAPEGRERSRD